LWISEWAWVGFLRFRVEERNECKVPLLNGHGDTLLQDFVQNQLHSHALLTCSRVAGKCNIVL
jgi:hypothetical protein